MIADNSSSQNNHEILNSFLRQRQTVIMESYTKIFDEQRRKAEEDYFKVNIYVHV